EIETLNLGLVGPRIEQDRVLFPEGVNVEFVHVRGTHDIRMRIWERGAGETLASGSGSCAAAVASIKRGFVESPVNVHMSGGAVEVEWSGGGAPVLMSGPAEYVCEGRADKRLTSESQSLWRK
ncbi:MAG: diaminopimelate epimerase, partial [Rubrobacteraceae bacterium]